MNFALFFADASPGILTYFAQSNVAGKIIVVALLLFSFLAWTVMIGKWLELSRLRALNGVVEQALSRTPDLTDIQKISPHEGPYAALVHEITAHSHSMSTAENALQRAVAQQSMQYESKMVLLASIVSGAPFLGLLGTVWGVMDAFGSMALQSSATLQLLAPGVSGALLTTVAGLLVAIPSVFGYNFLLNQTKMMLTELESFASILADRFEKESAKAQPIPATFERN